jgi:hypothetical protein
MSSVLFVFHVFLLGTVLTPTNAILFNNLGSFGIGLGVIWDRVGISLGSSWGRSGISLKVFREHFEHMLNIFWKPATQCRIDLK